MGATQRGTSLNLVNRFWTIDPLTDVSTLADPTVVAFEVLAPDGTETTYTSGVDANVTNPVVGVWVCALDPPLPAGTWRYRCEGTGAVEAASEELFDVLESGVLSPVASGVATPGPCSSWINGDDVAACGPDLGVGSDHWLLDDSAYDATFLLYELSGRQYPGVCTRTVRPCRETCGHWGGDRGIYYWGAVVPGGPWGWYGDGRGSCGCGTDDYVLLGGYPVREILQVKLNGVAVDPAEYVLNDRRRLVRRSDPGPPVRSRYWPACQDTTLPDTEPATFSVTYTWGADAPHLARMAAAQLARELYLACSGGDCKLPTKVTKIVRQGLTMERIVPLAEMLRSGSTGIQIVDAFLAGVNPGKITRRPAFFSPDTRQPARKIGQ